MRHLPDLLRHTGSSGQLCPSAEGNDTRKAALTAAVGYGAGVARPSQAGMSGWTSVSRTMKRKTLFVFAAGWLSCWMPMNALCQSISSALTEQSFDYEIRLRGTLRYLFYAPSEYSRQGERRWPLMLFLHGAGERGTNLQLVTKHGPPKLVQQGTNFPFLLIAPQCPEGRRWEIEPLLQLLDYVVARHAVDTNRVYLTGLSMGGYGAWKLGISHPERFAALAPICGGGEIIDVLLAAREKAAALRRLPVWAFHGAKDPVVPLGESERMVAALKKAGCPEVRLTVYPEAEHDSWTQTYSNPEFYEWLLAHRRESNP